MTTKLLRQAVAVAHDPHATSEQLLEVIGDLLAFGHLASAEAVVARLRANGSAANVVASFVSNSRVRSSVNLPSVNDLSMCARYASGCGKTGMSRNTSDCRR